MAAERAEKCYSYSKGEWGKGERKGMKGAKWSEGFMDANGTKAAKRKNGAKGTKGAIICLFHLCLIKSDEGERDKGDEG